MQTFGQEGNYELAHATYIATFSDREKQFQSKVGEAWEACQ